jgi:small subunit ribosomal protein S1
MEEKETSKAQIWARLREYQEDGTIITVKVAGVVPSGLVALAEGIRGFIPASHLALTYVEVDDSWLGKKLDVKVINVEEEEKKLVLSARAVLREKAQEEANQKIAQLEPGTVVEGTVESLMNYGAFVDIGDGVSGLVHISQISRKRIAKPDEVLKVGQKISAKILNTTDNKVSLSIRALEEGSGGPSDRGDRGPRGDRGDRGERMPRELISKEKVTTSLGDLLKGLDLE